MNNNKKILTTIGLAIILGLSFLLFFGLNANSKTNIQICSFIFTLITEIIIYLYIMLVTSKKLNTFMVAGLSGVVILYAISSLFVNILFYGIFNTLRLDLICNFSLLLLLLLIGIILFIFKKEK